MYAGLKSRSKDTFADDFEGLALATKWGG